MSITEGDWTYFPENDGGEVWAVRAGGVRQHVASHLHDDDGRLIAAAPKMLYLLKIARSSLSTTGHRDLEDRIWDVISEFLPPSPAAAIKPESRSEEAQ
jgi:hypothetical protein